MLVQDDAQVIRIHALTLLGKSDLQTNCITLLRLRFRGQWWLHILSGNCCYYAYGKLMKSRALNRSSKLKTRVYKSLIRPIVTCGCETWTLTNRDEQYLRIFERRIRRKIFGPVQNEDGFWRIGMNYELNDILKNAYIMRFVKSKRMASLGHVMRMEGKRIPKRVLEWKRTGTRNRGRPRRKMEWGHRRRYTDNGNKRVEKVV